MAIKTTGVREPVVRDPQIREGKPVLAGTRLGVHTVVGYYRLYAGDVDRIVAEFPGLTPETVEAALRWYEADEAHREEIDSLLRDQHAFYEAGLAAQRTSGQEAG